MFISEYITADVPEDKPRSTQNFSNPQTEILGIWWEKQPKLNKNNKIPQSSGGPGQNPGRNKKTQTVPVKKTSRVSTKNASKPKKNPKTTSNFTLTLKTPKKPNKNQ
jgi:hypothetical protein